MTRAEPSTPSSLPTPVDVLGMFARYPLRWIVPTVLVTASALAYAQLRPDTWEAVQGLIIRNEAAGNLEEPGKFRHTDEMKTVQETILELAKNRGVLAKALVQVGPPPEATETNRWPSAEDVDALAGALKLSPPKGAEFGKTEVFYLKVQHRDRQRAVALVAAVYEHLQARFQQLRDVRAQSMVDELLKTVVLAEADLEGSTRRLAALEREVGSDLAELRSLYERGSGDSDLRRRTLELENELRQAKQQRRNNDELYKLLSQAQLDHGRLLATPNRLLESQPSLKRLKDGLVDAQLATSQLLGRMTADHPLVRAALETEQKVSQHLHEELALALRGLEVDSSLAAARVDSLEQQLAGVNQRLEHLAALRAEYSSLAADVEHRTKLLQEAQRRLADARASQAGAATASLISRIDVPDTGSKPLGPGRKLIGLAGLLGGFLTGCGVLVLSAQPLTSAPDWLLSPTSPGQPITTYNPQSHRSVSLKKALRKMASTPVA